MRRSSIVAVQLTTLANTSEATDDIAALKSFSVTMQTGNRMTRLSRRPWVPRVMHGNAYLRRSMNWMMGTPSVGSNPETSTTSPSRYRYRPSSVVTTGSYRPPGTISHYNTSQRRATSHKECPQIVRVRRSIHSCYARSNRWYKCASDTPSVRLCGEGNGCLFQ